MKPDDVEWVVNDGGELGVRIDGTCYFLYKGGSLVYDDENDDTIRVRPVGKREFGECCYPPGWDGSEPYTKGEGWESLHPCICPHCGKVIEEEVER